MITPSMNYVEIANEYKRDFLEEIDRGLRSCFGKRDAMGHYVLSKVPNEGLYLFKPVVKKTKSQNEFTCRFYTHGKTNYRKRGIMRFAYMTYLRSDGLHIITSEAYNVNAITFYTPHFLDRYCERALNGAALSKKEAFEHFNINAHVSAFTDSNNPKYPNSIYGTSDAGVLLGVDLGDNLIEMRTYISFEMIKGEQIDTSEAQLLAIGDIKEILDNNPEIINAYSQWLDSQ